VPKSTSFRKLKKNKYIQEGEEKDLVRPYVNHVTVKLYKDKSFAGNSLMNTHFLSKNQDFEMYSQGFRINKTTTFDQLK